MTTATGKAIAGIKNPSYKGKWQKVKKSKEKFGIVILSPHLCINKNNKNKQSNENLSY